MQISFTAKAIHTKAIHTKAPGFTQSERAYSVLTVRVVLQIPQISQTQILTMGTLKRQQHC